MLFFLNTKAHFILFYRDPVPSDRPWSSFRSISCHISDHSRQFLSSNVLFLLCFTPKFLHSNVLIHRGPLLALSSVTFLFIPFSFSDFFCCSPRFTPWSLSPLFLFFSDLSVGGPSKNISKSCFFHPSRIY